MTACNAEKRIARKAREQAESRGEADGRRIIFHAMDEYPSPDAVRSAAAIRARAYGYERGSDVWTEYVDAFTEGAAVFVALRRAAAATLRAINALRGAS